MHTVIKLLQSNTQLQFVPEIVVKIVEPFRYLPLKETWEIPASARDLETPTFVAGKNEVLFKPPKNVKKNLQGSGVEVLHTTLHK